MSTYKAIFGKTIKHLSSDPDNSTYEGQIWYNTTEGKFKTVVATGAFSSAASLAGPPRESGGHSGTQTAGLIFGGDTNSPSPTTNINNTEEYNGSGWSTGGNLGTARRNIGGSQNGSQTAAFGAGGYTTAKTGAVEEYDGSTWTAGTSLSTSRSLTPGVGGGTLTAGIVFGGDTYPPAPTRASTATEEYDGTTWTAGGALGSGGYSNAGTGPQTSAIYFGGGSSGGQPNTGHQNYDGTSWTTQPSLPFQMASGACCGSQTDCLSSGGAATGQGTKTHRYNGSSWSADSDMTESRYNHYHQGASANSNFLVAGRAPPGFLKSTEEYNFSANTVTAGAWASGGNLSQARTEHAAAQNSTENAGLVFGGFDGSTTIYNATEEYNGSAWSSGGNLPQGLRVPGGAGTQTAGLSVAGRNGPSPTARINNTYEYDGSTWTDGGNYPATQAYTGALGTQTTALAFGGENPSGTDLTTSNHYDGSTWTAGGTLNTAGYNNRGFGSSASALCAFRAGSPTGLETESYDGSTWTSVNSMNNPTVQGGSAGSYPNGIAFGGATPGINTEGWDGTNWSTRPAMSTARRCEGFGTETAGVAAGGETPGSPTSATTEEFTGETTSINIESVDNS